MYFSAATLVATVAPMWVARLMTVVNLLAPLHGHCGHGSSDRSSTHDHYIHHSRFDWNYGGKPFWDQLMGTDYKPGTTLS